MGLLDTLSVDGIANVAVPDAGRSLAVAAAVVAVVVTSPRSPPRCSPLVGRRSRATRRPWVEARCPLGDAGFLDARGPLRALRRAPPDALQAI